MSSACHRVFAQSDVSGGSSSTTKNVGQWSIKADLNMTADNFRQKVSDPALEVN